MAWMIREFRVRYRYKDSVEIEQPLDFTKVYLSVWEKKNNEWVEIASAQSDKLYESE